MSIGIHSGEAVLGNIGPGSRVELTIIGKALEITERVNRLNGEYRTTALISETTWEKIQSDLSEFTFTEMGDFLPEHGFPMLRLFTLAGLGREEMA